MKASILIVNWNSKDFLRKCLTSIAATCSDIRPQIVVVDGGSFDGCAEMLADEFPHVEFVQSDDNVGFGRANNLGLTRVTGEAVWVLNPDTEVHPGALQMLLRELDRLPDAGIVSPRLVNTDGTPQSSVHALPNPVLQAIDCELLRRLLWPLRLWAPPSDFVPAETVEVGAVAGTAMLMRTSVFRNLGGFTPAYFMYAEDMDLCLKVRRAGLRVYHVPEAVVTHHGGASSSAQGSSFSAVMMCEALRIYMRLNRGRVSAAIYRLAVATAAVVRLAMVLPATILSGAERRPERKAALRRWWSVLSWSCGGQQWTKRYAAAADASYEGRSAPVSVE